MTTHILDEWAEYERQRMASHIEEVFAWMNTQIVVREPDTSGVRLFDIEDDHMQSDLSWFWVLWSGEWCSLTLYPEGRIWFDAALTDGTIVNTGSCLHNKTILNETVKRLEAIIGIPASE